MYGKLKCCCFDSLAQWQQNEKWVWIQTEFVTKCHSFYRIFSFPRARLHWHHVTSIPTRINTNVHPYTSTQTHWHNFIPFHSLRFVGVGVTNIWFRTQSSNTTEQHKILGFTGFTISIFWLFFWRMGRPGTLLYRFLLYEW